MRLEWFFLLTAVTALARGLTSAVSREPFAVMDRPNARSLHEVPVSRLGGVAVIIAGATGVAGAVMTGLTTFHDSIALTVGAAASLVFFCSVTEDVRGLSPVVRLTAQSVAAVLVVVGVVSSGHYSVANVADGGFLIAAVVGIVWMANLFNFMDGLDGLAGGMSVLGFGALAVVAALHGAGFVATASLMIAAAALGFLSLNFPPARATLSSILVLQHDVAAFVPAIIFLPFLLDATVTLLERIRHGERVWQPHRRHWYQRLVLAGWSHRQVLCLYWPLMASGGTVAIVLQTTNTGNTAIVVAGVLALHLLIPGFVWTAERRANSGQRNMGV